MFARKSSVLEAYKAEDSSNSPLDISSQVVHNLPSLDEVSSSTAGTNFTVEQIEIAKLLREAKTTYSSLSSRLSGYIFATQDAMKLDQEDLSDLMNCIISIKIGLDDNVNSIMQVVLKK